MTTPKRAKYNLRNRLVPDADVSGHDASLLSLGDDNDAEEGIMDEEVPQTLIDGQIEALQEENKCLQVGSIVYMGL